MTALADLLRQRIAREGPISLADYMATVLGHPRLGVYAAADPFGRGGHFVTAPEISQMFGELVGLWLAVVWREIGRPDPVRVLELGPGRGTLLGDALRATAKLAGFHAALRLHLVEASPLLRRRQAESLAGFEASRTAQWHASLAEVPDGATLAIANEFFDALPIRQFERAADGWRERFVDATEAGGFRWLAVPAPEAASLVPAALRDAPLGSVFEVCPAGIELAGALAQRVVRAGGAALVIDYGHARRATGATLQAVRRHRVHDPLVDPGSADLTAHVDFAALKEAATAAGARVTGPLAQGEFLRRLGIELRAQRLSRAASPERARDIEAALRRLTEAGAMGVLFKAIAIASPKIRLLPGFE